MINSIKCFINDNSFVVVILKMIVIFIVTIILNKIFRKLYKKSRVSEKIHLNFLSSIISAVIYILGIIAMIYQIPGMNKLASTLLAGSGILAAALGLGAKEAFGNILSGIVLSISKPFDIGDRVIIRSSPEITGFVEDITLRHTIIRTYKNTDFIITNSMLDNLIVENTTRNSDELGIVEFVDVSVAYESDLQKAKSIIEDIIGSNELFYDTRTPEDIARGAKKVTVRSRELADSGITVRVTLRAKTIADSFILKDYAIDSIKKAFDEQGIEIPYNKVVVINNE